MDAVLTATLHLEAVGRVMIPDVEVELELMDGALRRVVCSGVGITETYVAGINDPLAKVIWNAAVEWVDENQDAVIEAEYEAAETEREIAYERRREIAA